MPRRESYRTDDEDDDARRRAHASGGGVPAWVWLVGGGGVLAAVVVVGLGLLAFTARRAEVRAETARAEVMRLEADHRAHAHAPDFAMKPAAPGHAPPGLVNDDDDDPAAAPTPLAEIAAAYRADPAAADERFKGRRVRVALTVEQAGPGWVSTTARLTPDVPPPGARPNVVIDLLDRGGPVRVGVPTAYAATCDGLTAEPDTGRTLLRFTAGRPVGR